LHENLKVVISKTQALPSVNQCQRPPAPGEDLQQSEAASN
jgi:hypothetical protein